jgi:hydroxymethylpyrimidine/phosphomethylpyrimidine kinase
MVLDKKMAEGPVCLAIGGLDPSGGAGLIADVRTITGLGCRAAAAITSVTFQNDKHMTGAEHLSAETVRHQLEAVLEQHDVAAVKTGMLPTNEIVKTVAEIIARHSLPNLIIDPVMVSTSGHRLIDNLALKAILDHLLPMATLITPNVPEAEYITGISIESIDDIYAIAEILSSKGARSVLLKGGHMPAAINMDEKGARISRDFLFADGEMSVLEGPFIDHSDVRGTGCMLASAIAAKLANGMKLHETVDSAKSQIYGLMIK